LPSLARGGGAYRLGRLVRRRPVAAGEGEDDEERPDAAAEGEVEDARGLGEVAPDVQRAAEHLQREQPGEGERATPEPRSRLAHLPGVERDEADGDGAADDGEAVEPVDVLQPPTVEERDRRLRATGPAATREPGAGADHVRA